MTSRVRSKGRPDAREDGSKPRAWQRMLSGRRLDLLDPSPLDIEIEDIAHGLARVARWNGQTVGTHALSVAQHSLIVEEISAALEPAWPLSCCLMALLHDAPEYVVGDLISPFKAAIGLDYKAFEKRLLRAIYMRFSLPSEAPADVAETIKRADRIAAYYEATRLAGFTESDAARYFERPVGLPPVLVERLAATEAWPTGTAQRCFLERFAELTPR